MRGWRCIGRACDEPDQKLAHIDDGQMLLFACYADGRGQRSGGQAVRVREVKRYFYPHHALADAVYDDYMFVATAIGEDAFK